MKPLSEHIVSLRVTEEMSFSARLRTASSVGATYGRATCPPSHTWRTLWVPDVTTTVIVFFCPGAGEFLSSTRSVSWGGAYTGHGK